MSHGNPGELRDEIMEALRQSGHVPEASLVAGPGWDIVFATIESFIGSQIQDAKRELVESLTRE